MRWTLRILLLSLATATFASGQDAQQELARLETAWNMAHIHGDADALEKLWHPDLLVTVPRMPPLTRAEAAAFAHSGRMVFQRYETSDLTFRIYGSTALVSGRMRRSRTINGNPVSDDWRFTKTYLRDDNGWRVVSFHASEAEVQR